MASRKLTPAERAFAYKVFQNGVRYDDVWISDDAINGQIITTHFNGVFTIRWGDGPGFNGIMDDEGRKATFIHEMTHVWQGCNNGIFTGTYQAKSVIAQVREGVRDIVKTKDYRKGIEHWDRHRSTAYRLDASRFSQPWSSFNVEQQATIVETWYIDEILRRGRDDGPGVFGASMSPYDARFPYIRDVIRKRSPTAGYAPVQLPTGADPSIKQLQDKLVTLGYLEAPYADGLIGRTHSATLDAVREFQKRNGLKPDRNLGGANSDTRKVLLRPADQLRRSQ